MKEDTDTNDSGAQFGADVDNIYGEEEDEEKESDQSETKNKECSG